MNGKIHETKGVTFIFIKRRGRKEDITWTWRVKLREGWSAILTITFGILFVHICLITTLCFFSLLWSSSRCSYYTFITDSYLCSLPLLLLFMTGNECLESGFLPACLSIHQTSHSRLGSSLSLFASQFHWTAMLYRLSVSHSFISYCVLILSSLYFYQMAKYDFRFHSILQVWRCCSRRWHTMSNLF